MDGLIPIAFFTRNRPCLIVGGGKVAARKINNFLAQYAMKLRVIAPTLTDGLLGAHQAGRFEWIARPFQEEDVAGCALVFAVTDSEAVNRSVLESARKHGIPCACSDALWNESDFIAMATAHFDHVKIAVSTGGESCRQSRLIRDWMARHLPPLTQTVPFIIGTDHMHLSLDEREHLQRSDAERIALGKRLALIASLHEFMILNTCNRLELWALGTPSEETVEILLELLNFKSLGKDKWFMHTEQAAIAHAAHVASGLRSQTPGEKHIVAQIKSAHTEAQAHRFGAKTLEEWFNLTLHLSRGIRQKIGPLLRGMELEDAAVAYAQKAVPNPRHIAVLGSGAIGSGLLQKLKGINAVIHWFYHRNRPDIPSDSVAQIELHNLSECNAVLPQVQWLFSAVKSDRTLVKAGAFPAQKNLLMLDLSLPRTLDPAWAETVSLVNLDDLKHDFRRNHCDAKVLHHAAEQAIKAQHAYIHAFLNTLQHPGRLNERLYHDSET